MRRSSSRRVRYGTRRGQVAILRPSPVPGPQPTVVFVHGGSWRWPYNRWSMLLLVRDAQRRGWTTLNVGYRRLGRFGGGGGWPETFDDVRDAIDLTASHHDVIDVDRVVLAGHSAGGHLALWAAREVTVKLAGVISMAGVTDLEAAVAREWKSARALLRRAPLDGRYELTSPQHRLPLGVPVACVHGADDTTVPSIDSEAFIAAAEAGGDDASIRLVPGERHIDVLRTRSAMWAATALIVDGFFASGAPGADRRANGL